MHTINLTQAIDTFSDNIDEIIDTCALNLHTDLQKLKKEGEQLGTNWVADEVRKLILKDRLGARIQTVKRLTGYREAKRNPRKGSITDADIERAKESPIEDMYTGKLHKGSGKSKYVALCPLHFEKTPSFHIFKDNRYKCFGCGEWGSSIDFHMKINNSTFINSVKALSNCG